MDGYIKADDLVDFFDHIIGEQKNQLSQIADKMANYTNATKTADVAPVVHGEWIRDVRTPPFANSKCSKCGKTYGLYPLGYNYCPNCGARMDGGK